MDCEIYERDNGTNEVWSIADWKDAHYQCNVYTKTVGIRRKVSRDGKKIYKDTQKGILRETLSDVINGVEVGDDSICCPNCGSVSTIAELQTGCKFCGTQYKMDDLYPKVTSFSHQIDGGVTNKEGKLGYLVCYLISAGILAGYFLLFSEYRIGSDGFKGVLPAMIVSILLFGLIFGYILYVFYLVISSVVKGSRNSSGKLGAMGTRRKFEQRMKQIAPDFSFEYFVGKALSLTRTTIFTKDETKFLFYYGQPIDPHFKEIIDLGYGGAMGLNNFVEENGMLTVDTTIFFNALYYKDGKVRTEYPRFRAVFQRRTDIPMNCNFSMTRIQCPSCGASFDAVLNRDCPYCGHNYEMISRDWVLIYLALS